MTDSTLDSAIVRVYGGPLDDFIPRRDALSKEFRSAGDRDAAATIKALRKPSRTAWALDIAALENTEALDGLVGAITETIQANAGGGDVRAAMTRMRSAVRA